MPLRVPSEEAEGAAIRPKGEAQAQAEEGDVLLREAQGASRPLLRLKIGAYEGCFSRRFLDVKKGLWAAFRAVDSNRFPESEK